MTTTIAHPTNENLRIAVTLDQAPAKPYHDGGFPIWRIEPSRGAYNAVQETDITSYVTPGRLDQRLSDLNTEHDLDGPFVLRYLRIFWGVTFVQMWHSGSDWYLTCDPDDWREFVGVNEEAIGTDAYPGDPFEEWRAWCEGDVHVATEQARMWQRTTTRTWDPTRAENPEDPESSDEVSEDTTDEFIWDDRDSVAGFYGDVDQAMATTMAWQFGWQTPDGHTFQIEED
jgi:hypothetical protein